METNNRRDFLKKAALAGASALVAPSLFAADGEGRGELSPKIKAGDLESKLIVPKNNGLKITGTFLDEISHDIPHQNWGEKEWDLDFQHMKRIGIDTVIMIRSGYRKFMTYPSEAVLISFDKSVKHDLDECNLYHSFCGFSKEFIIDGQPSEVFQP